MARTGLKKIIKGEGSGSGKKSATNRPQRNGGTAATHAAVTASAKKRNASQKTTATRKMMPRTTTHNTRDDSKRELLDRDFANSHPGSRKIMLDKKAPAFPVAADSKSRAGDDKLAQTFEALMS